MAFRITPLTIPDVLRIDYDVLKDERGSFAELYRVEALAAHGIPQFVQDNVSRSRRGVVRGLHYQLEPKALGKLVRCTRGRIFDVALDLRRSSSSYGKWVSMELDENTPAMLWIPPGFAHGLQALDDAEVHYKQSGYYSPQHERAITWNDPELKIAWPILPAVVSAKDAAAPRLSAAENNFR